MTCPDFEQLEKILLSNDHIEQLTIENTSLGTLLDGKPSFGKLLTFQFNLV